MPSLFNKAKNHVSLTAKNFSSSHYCFSLNKWTSMTKPRILTHFGLPFIPNVFLTYFSNVNQGWTTRKEKETPIPKERQRWSDQLFFCTRRSWADLSLFHPSLSTVETSLGVFENYYLMIRASSLLYCVVIATKMFQKLNLTSTLNIFKGFKKYLRVNFTVGVEHPFETFLTNVVKDVCFENEFLFTFKKISANRKSNFQNHYSLCSPPYSSNRWSNMSCDLTWRKVIVVPTSIQ